MFLAGCDRSREASRLDLQKIRATNLPLVISDPSRITRYRMLEYSELKFEDID